MVACGSSKVDIVPDTGDGAPANSRDSSGTMGAIADALTNPESSAMAGGGTPDVAVEQCDKMAPETDGGPNVRYAEHAYPGKTTTDLVALHAAYHYTTGPFYGSYSVSTAPNIFIKDGSALVACGPNVDTVTFVLQ
jgi:hypothetical protein